MTPIEAWPAIRGGGRQPCRVLFVQGLAGFVLIMPLLVVKHVVTSGEAATADPLASMPGERQLPSAWSSAARGATMRSRDWLVHSKFTEWLTLLLRTWLI